MSELTSALYSADEVRELDRSAIEDHGVPSYDLMCRAGAGLLDVVQLRWPAAKHVLVVCGGGNNGGDGYVLARLLLQAGAGHSVLAAIPTEKLQSDARRAWQDYVQAGGQVYEQWPEQVAVDLIVDALFGSGLCRPVTGAFAALIQRINDTGVPALAVDVPSGLDASTGAVHGIAVRAQATLTFIGHKRGLLTHEGPDYAGKVWLDALAVPPAVFLDNPTRVFRLDATDIGQRLPVRARASHKGSFAAVIVIGGQAGMEGAAVLAAAAALRSGAGLVRLTTLSRRERIAILPDVIQVPAPDEAALAQTCAQAGVLAIGPGLGQSPEARAWLNAALLAEVPTVLDADALNLLAQDSACRLSSSTVLTPHPAEAARLLGISTAEVQADRFAAAIAIAQRYSAVVVLKGVGSLITDGERIALCTAGNPGMACAGMGDVLTGVIAGCLAQRLSAFDAACLGVCAHAAAGDLAYRARGNSLLASDLDGYLPEVFKTRG